MIALSLALRNSLYGTSHYLIAEKYKAISRTIPQTLACEKQTEEGKCEQASMKLLFWGNLLLPIIQGFAVYLFNNKVLNGGVAKPWVVVLNAVATVLIAVV